ncbi:hypothetical protein [Bdellovibrio bacteriovorus]|uniref:hypothetical protein n=1 Tax=Bdellovibrio bacteriovorus TaxID=959 RepID=UPI0035A8350A
METYTYDADGLMLTKTRRDGSVKEKFRNMRVNLVIMAIGILCLYGIKSLNKSSIGNYFLGIGLLILGAVVLGILKDYLSSKNKNDQRKE